MQVVNFTEARNNLKSLFDTVYNDSEEIIINRKHGENVVIISLDNYNAMKETDYLFSSPKNRDRLLRSLENARGGNAKERELEE